MDALAALADPAGIDAADVTALRHALKEQAVQATTGAFDWNALLSTALVNPESRFDVGEVLELFSLFLFAYLLNFFCLLAVCCLM